MQNERVKDISQGKEAYAAYIEFGRQWKQFDDLYHKAAVASGLSVSAFEILFALYDLGEGCLQRDICAYSYASKQTINSSVHKLKDEGLVRLEPVDTGRGVRIYFTEAGKALADERVAPFARADLQVFAALGKEMRENLICAQRRYLQGIEASFAPLYESVAEGVAKERG